VQLAERMNRIGVESAFDVLVQARELERSGRSIMHLEIGEPDFETPRHIVNAAKQALDDGWTHYGPAQGYLDLRDAIAADVGRTRGVQVGPENVCVVPGGKPIIFFTMLALLEPGDEVVYPNPGFPIYESVIRFLGATPVPMPLEEKRGFSFDIDLLKSKLSRRTKLLVLNSPQNPTGAIIGYQDMRAIAETVQNHDLMVLSDEIYSRIVYETPAISIASLPGMLGKTVILDGFSKTYAMTGWRMGYGIMPGWLAEAVSKLMVNSNSCTASFTQRAGLAALNGGQDDVNRMIEEFRRRRNAFVTALNELPGFRCALPGGAFYAFANVRATGVDSGVLAHQLLYQAGVACLSGTAFGEHGNGYIRFSYAASYQNLIEAAHRMRCYLDAAILPSPR
jgi:aspartate aminotransferase